MVLPVRPHLLPLLSRDIARAVRARLLWHRAELGLARTARALNASAEGPLAAARTLMLEMAATLPDGAPRQAYLAQMTAEAERSPADA